MDLSQVLTALRNADAAGDKEAATRLAQIAQQMQAQPVEAPAPAKKSTIGSELLRGAKQLGSGYVTGIEALGDAEAAGIAGLQRQKEIAEAAGEGVSWDAVKKAYADKGVLSATGEFIGQVPRAVAGQAANIGAMATGARLGAMAGSAVMPGVGTLVGGALGAGAALLPQFFGSNVERQVQAAQEAGKEIKVDRTSALGAAVAQAGMEGVGGAFAVGKRALGTILGKDLIKAGGAKAEQELLAAANRSVAGTLGRGAVRGAAAEMPVELAQQVLERAQAGLSLTDKDAMSEYGDTLYQTALMAGPIGSAGAVYTRAGAKKEIAAQQAEKDQLALVERQRLAEEEKAAKQAEFEARAAEPTYIPNLIDQYNLSQQELNDLKKQSKDRTLTEEQRDALKVQFEEARDKFKELQAEYAANKDRITEYQGSQGFFDQLIGQRDALDAQIAQLKEQSKTPGIDETAKKALLKQVADLTRQRGKVEKDLVARPEQLAAYDQAKRSSAPKPATYLELSQQEQQLKQAFDAAIASGDTAAIAQVGAQHKAVLDQLNKHPQRSLEAALAKFEEEQGKEEPKPDVLSRLATQIEKAKQQGADETIYRERMAAEQAERDAVAQAARDEETNALLAKMQDTAERARVRRIAEQQSILQGEEETALAEEAARREAQAPTGTESIVGTPMPSIAGRFRLVGKNLVREGEGVPAVTTAGVREQKALKAQTEEEALRKGTPGELAYQPTLFDEQQELAYSQKEGVGSESLWGPEPDARTKDILDQLVAIKGKNAEQFANVVPREEGGAVRHAQMAKNEDATQQEALDAYLKNLNRLTYTSDMLEKEAEQKGIKKGPDLTDFRNRRLEVAQEQAGKARNLYVNSILEQVEHERLGKGMNGLTVAQAIEMLNKLNNTVDVAVGSSGKVSDTFVQNIDAIKQDFLGRRETKNVGFELTKPTERKLTTKTEAAGAPTETAAYSELVKEKEQLQRGIESIDRDIEQYKVDGRKVHLKRAERRKAMFQEAITEIDRLMGESEKGVVGGAEANYVADRLDRSANKIEDADKEAAATMREARDLLLKDKASLAILKEADAQAQRILKDLTPDTRKLVDLIGEAKGARTVESGQERKGATVGVQQQLFGDKELGAIRSAPKKFQAYLHSGEVSKLRNNVKMAIKKAQGISKNITKAVEGVFGKAQETAYKRTAEAIANAERDYNNALGLLSMVEEQTRQEIAQYQSQGNELGKYKLTPEGKKKLEEYKAEFERLGDELASIEYDLQRAFEKVKGMRGATPIAVANREASMHAFAAKETEGARNKLAQLKSDNMERYLQIKDELTALNKDMAAGPASQSAMDKYDALNKELDDMVKKEAKLREKLNTAYSEAVLRRERQLRLEATTYKSVAKPLREARAKNEKAINDVVKKINDLYGEVRDKPLTKKRGEIAEEISKRRSFLKDINEARAELDEMMSSTVTKYNDGVDALVTSLVYESPKVKAAITEANKLDSQRNRLLDNRINELEALSKDQSQVVVDALRKAVEENTREFNTRVAPTLIRRMNNLTAKFEKADAALFDNFIRPAELRVLYLRGLVDSKKISEELRWEKHFPELQKAEKNLMELYGKQDALYDEYEEKYDALDKDLATGAMRMAMIDKTFRSEKSKLDTLQADFAELKGERAASNKFAKERIELAKAQAKLQELRDAYTAQKRIMEQRMLEAQAKNRYGRYTTSVQAEQEVRGKGKLSAEEKEFVKMGGTPYRRGFVTTTVNFGPKLPEGEILSGKRVPVKPGSKYSMSVELAEELAYRKETGQANKKSAEEISASFEQALEEVRALEKMYKVMSPYMSKNWRDNVRDRIDVMRGVLDANAILSRYGDLPPRTARPSDFRVGKPVMLDEYDLTLKAIRDLAAAKGGVTPSKDAMQAARVALKEATKFKSFAELRASLELKKEAGKKAAMREGTAPVTPVDATKARMHVEKIQDKMAKNGIKFVYADSLEDAPEGFHDALAAHGMDNAKGAILADGTVVVIGDMHSSIKDLEETVAHEVVGHYGVEGALGKEGLTSLTKLIFSKPGQINQIADALGVLEDVLGAEQAGKGMNLTQPEIQEMMVRELIAHTAEAKAKSVGAVDTVKNWIKTLVNAVRTWFKKLGMDDVARATTSDIQKLVNQSFKQYTHNELPAYRSPNGKVAFRMGQPAYATGYSPTAIELEQRLIGRQKGLIDEVRATANGMVFATKYVDSRAGLEYLARGMQKMGIEKELEGMQTMYWARTFDARSLSVAQAASSGPQMIKKQMRKDGQEEYVLASSGAPSLKDIVKRVGEASKGIGDANTTLRQFGLYLIAKRATRLGVEKALGFDLSAAEEAKYKQQFKEILALHKDNAAFQDAASMYAEYNKALMNLLAQSGYISQETANALTKHGDYVGFYRQGDKLMDGEGTVTIGDISKQKYLQELVGGGQQIVDFQTSALQNTSLIMDLALRNLATRNTAFMLESLGYSKIRDGAGPASANIVRFKRHGKDVHAVVDTDASGLPTEVLMKGLEGVATTLPAGIKLLQGPANLLRKWVTRMPMYVVRQVMRDSMAAAIVSGSDAMPITTATKQLYSIYKGTNQVERGLQEKGFLGGQQFTGDMAQDKKLIESVASGKVGFARMMDKLDRLAMAADASARVTAYNSYIAQGMSDMEASLAALEIMNFTKRGVSPTARYAAMLIPFFNAQVQGLNVLAKSFRGTNLFEKKLNMRKKMLERGSILMGMTLLYAMAMQDDEAYKNATMEERMNNWFVRLPGLDEPLRVPIPFEIGTVFKAIPELLFNLAASDTQLKDAVPALLNTARNTLPGGSNWGVPQAMKPLIEIGTNHSFFTGKEIEGQRYAGIEPGMRYGKGTTELAKALGSTLGISPIKIDYLVRGYMGNAGVLMMSALDPFMEDAGPVDRKLSETPFIGPAFQPNEGRGYINSAYDTAERIQQARGTYKKLIEEGKPAEAMAYARENAKLLSMASFAGSFKQRMGELAAAQRRIEAMPESEMSPTRKRELLEQIRTAQIALSKQLRLGE